MTKPKMTPKQFEAARSRFGRLTDDTIEMARQVLVDGQPQTEVARQHELTRQRVSLAVKQVLTVVDEIPKGWVRLEIWLPPTMARKVRDMAEKAKQQTKKKVSIDLY